MKSTRLDEWLVQQGHYASRARARDAILRGCVTINAEVAAKPSAKIIDGRDVTIDDPALHFVSRAALKLVHALEVTSLSAEGKIALDLGASTGGFCQVLLEAGASRVYAIDVGHDQMDKRLRSHPKLKNIENLNVRDLTSAHLEGDQPDLVTCDVSFISLKLALPRALGLAAPGASGIFLIKPQFEVGKDLLGKGGIVRDENTLHETVEDIRSWLGQQDGWRVTHLMESPIIGGDGNREYLLAAQKHG